MANAQLKAICPLKYPVLSVFSVATAVSSLPRVLRRRWRGPGGLQKCSSAQVRPLSHLATPLLPLATSCGLLLANTSCAQFLAPK